MGRFEALSGLLKKAKIWKRARNIKKVSKASKAAKGAKIAKGIGKVGTGIGLGALATGAGSMLGNLAKIFNPGDSMTQAQNDVNASHLPAASNVPSKEEVMSNDITSKLDELNQGNVDSEIRQAKAKEEEAKIQKSLMDQILAASESLNNRTHNLVNEHGLGSIRESEANINVPAGLMTRGQIAQLYEKRTNDTRMSDILRLLAANNEILGNVDLHLGLLIKQGTIIPESNIKGAEVLRRLAEADKKLSQSLDNKIRRSKEGFNDAKKEESKTEKAILGSIGDSGSLNASSIINRGMSMMAVLGLVVPAIAALVDGLISKWFDGAGLFGENNNNISTSYEEIEDFNNLPKEQQEAAIKQGALDNLKLVGGMAAAEGAVLGGKKLIRKVTGKKATEQAVKTATKKGLLSKFTPAALKIVGKRLLTKVGLKAAAKTAAKKVPILGAAFGIWNGIKRAARGDWSGAGLEILSGLMGGSGAGILGSVAIDAGLVYRDYRKAMKALEEGDIKTLNDLGITNEDINEITAEVSEADLKKDDGKSPEQVLGMGDPQADALSNKVASDIEKQNANSVKAGGSTELETTATRVTPNNQRKPDGKKHAKGGWISGPSHENGGVFTELEGGEFVVNKDSAIENKELLEEINKSRKQLSDLVTKQLGMPQVQQQVQPQIIQVNNVDSRDALKESIDANSTTNKLNDTLGLLTSVLQGIRYEMSEQRRKSMYARIGGGRRGVGGTVYNQYNIANGSQNNLGSDSNDIENSEGPDANMDLSMYNLASDKDTMKRADYVAKYLINKGFTPAQAAGMAGVLIAESGVDPTAVNEEEVKKYSWHVAGKGICQWSNDRNDDFIRWYQNKYRTTEEVYPSSAPLEDQLEFMLYEMSKRPAFQKAMRRATTPGEAADIMLRGFENGGPNALASPEQINERYGSNNYRTQISKRAGFANNVYQNLQSKEFIGVTREDLGIPYISTPQKPYIISYRTEQPEAKFERPSWKAPWMVAPNGESFRESRVTQSQTPLIVDGHGQPITWAPQTYNQGGSTYNDNRQFVTYNQERIVKDDAKAAEV